MVMLREPVAVSVLVTLVVVAGCGGGESDSDPTTRDTAVVVSSVAGGVEESVVPTGGEPGDGSLEEEVLVDGSGVVLQVRTTGPSGAADTLIVLHGGPGLSLEAMEGYRLLAGADRLPPTSRSSQTRPSRRTQPTSRRSSRRPCSSQASTTCSGWTRWNGTRRSSRSPLSTPWSSVTLGTSYSPSSRTPPWPRCLPSSTRSEGSS